MTTQQSEADLLPAARQSDSSLADESSRRLELSDFLDFPRLVRMQRAYARIANLSVMIMDANGRPLGGLEDSANLSRPGEEQLVGPLVMVDQRPGHRHYQAPIRVEGQHLGTLQIRWQRGRRSRMSIQQLRELGQALELTDEQIEQVLQAAQDAYGPSPQAAVQLVRLWANGITRSCYHEYQLRQRVQELSALYRLSTVLTAGRDMQQVLDAACREAAEVMEVKAASIRLLSPDGKQAITRAVYNLSEDYVNKGPVVVEHSELYRQVLSGDVVYVEDMATDPRVVYPESARREGLSSFLAAGMIYQGKPIGVIRLYTGLPRQFTRFEMDLLKAIAQFTAGAIKNIRLNADYEESQRVQRQLKLAGDVQRRMLPSQMPTMPPFDIAARYVPSMDLSGDFFDFLDLQGHLGVAVADVVGKGVPASLLMSSVRASLRAHAQAVYDIEQIVSRVNKALCRDTLDNEFVTLFYGVLDPLRRRLTYCNAGHEPPLLLRKGNILTTLTVGGMIVGVDRNQCYDKGLVDLEPGDLLLIYTDGLSEAFNFAGQKFGRQRIIESMQQAAHETAHGALNHILWQMRRFVGLNRTPDDLTLVCIKVTDDPPTTPASLTRAGLVR